MSHRYSSFFAIVALCSTLGLWSCSTTTIENHIQQTGSILGKVYLLDSDTTLFDVSGVTVSLEGTSFSTMTDINGNWELDFVPAQSYIINYTREGFGESKQVVFHYGGAPTLTTTQTLCKIPPCVPVLDSFVYNVDMSYVFGTIPCISDEKTARVAYFLSNTPDVSKEDGKFIASRVTAGSRYAYCPISSYDFSPGGYFFGSGLDPKQTIYVVAYLVGCNGFIIDMPGEIYTSIAKEPSNVFAINLPQ